MLEQMIPRLRMLYSQATGGGLASAVFCDDTTLEARSADMTVAVDDNLMEKFWEHVDLQGYPPPVVVIKEVGFVALGINKVEAEAAKRRFLELVRPTSTPAERLPSIKRLDNKIAVVTGGAQGFGKGIAEDLAEQGAYVIIADINEAGAAKSAAALNDRHGEHTAFPVKVDVTDAESVARLVRETVHNYGGLDILISNAGVVRSGTVFELTEKDFNFVTDVNYKAFFLCAKYAAAIMKVQFETAPKYWGDIIEINSKSGLEGSNKNFAYAGSKFGGIGLVQSFALEFVEYGIKVNAVCPGNFLDGPLWSDPENGLFKQYLDAGKVKGAETVADVRKYYESRVPMGRGCEIADVSRAILYAVEQRYETGQAIPVTGGQVMLK